MHNEIKEVIKISTEILVTTALLFTVIAFTFVSRQMYQVVQNNDAINKEITEYSKVYKLDYEKTNTAFSVYDSIDTIISNAKMYTFKIKLRDNEKAIILRDPFVISMTNGEQSDSLWQYTNKLLNSSECIIAGKSSSKDSYLNNVSGDYDNIEWADQHNIWTNEYLSEIFSRSTESEFKCRIIPSLPEQAYMDDIDKVDKENWQELGFSWEQLGVAYILIEEV